MSEARGRGEQQARAEAAVVADAAMQSGDPRGELLSLELAAAATRDPIRARRIHRAAQVVRDQHPELAWPRGPELDKLSLRTRAGYVIAAALPEVMPSDAWLEHPATDRLRRVEVGRSPQLARVLERLAARPRALELLGVELDELDMLERMLPHLAGVAMQGLRIGFDDAEVQRLAATRERIPSLARLASLGQLRVLSLPGFVDVKPLAHAPLEALDCWSRDRESLAAIAQLAQLRVLCLRHDDELEPLVAAQRLESLALTGARAHELPLLAELPALHSLALADPPSPTQLAGLERLARLELRGAVPSRLAPLATLSQLELLGLRGSPREPGPLDLGPLAELPRLHTLILDLGEHTPRGCDRLVGLRSLRVIGSVDLRWFAGTALDELTITEGISPRSLPRLSELGPLRRLRLPARVLHGIDGTTLARLLPELETLELAHATSPLVPEQFAGFPRLRRLVLDGIDRTRARFFAEELPEIAVEPLAELDDPLDLAGPFDWRGVAWPKASAT